MHIPLSDSGIETASRLATLGCGSTYTGTISQPTGWLPLYMIMYTVYIYIYIIHAHFKQPQLHPKVDINCTHSIHDTSERSGSQYLVINLWYIQWGKANIPKWGL